MRKINMAQLRILLEKVNVASLVEKIQISLNEDNEQIARLLIELKAIHHCAESQLTNEQVFEIWMERYHLLPVHLSVLNMLTPCQYSQLHNLLSTSQVMNESFENEFALAMIRVGSPNRPPRLGIKVKGSFSFVEGTTFSYTVSPFSKI